MVKQLFNDVFFYYIRSIRSISEADYRTRALNGLRFKHDVERDTYHGGNGTRAGYRSQARSSRTRIVTGVLH